MVGSIVLIEILFLNVIHRITYLVSLLTNFSVVTNEIILFFYRFFGFGITIWVLIYFWGKNAIYEGVSFDEVKEEITVSENEPIEQI